MNPTVFSDAELDALALQVDEQLNELRALESTGDSWLRSESLEKGAELPAAPKQRAVIEEQSGEPFESFWDKIMRNIREDMCEPDGHLNQMWKTYQNLSSKGAVGAICKALAAIGVAPVAIYPLAVAAAVILLNTVANIGLEMWCEKCAKPAL